MPPPKWTPESVLEWITKICVSEDEAAVERLAAVCREMGAAILKYLEFKGCHFSECGETTEYRQLACTGISYLFYRETGGSYPYLKKLFLPLLERQASAEEVLFLLRRVLFRLMRQQVCRLLQERDPDGTRVRRNVCLAAQKIKGVKLNRDIGQTIEYYPPNLPAGLSFVYPPWDILQAAMVEFRPQMTVDQLLGVLLKKLILLLGKPIILNVTEASELITQYYKAIQDPDSLLDEPSLMDLYPLLRRCWAAAEQSLRVIQNLLQSQYIEKQKLTDFEALALFTVFKETMLARLQSEDPDFPISVEVLRRWWPELEDKRYHQQIRPLLDYLTRVYRQEMQKRLMRFLQPDKPRPKGPKNRKPDE
ncbi:MAG: hypothetical protein ONA69_09445 [candidate division KSB1 bacterium]|nr:hypothetical protein [candidate division KSB1 bacterium]MDZ7346999.1 hypothetical protein [candidate division KSB1 bacterium]